jgi:hypothetical protein
MLLQFKVWFESNDPIEENQLDEMKLGYGIMAESKIQMQLQIDGKSPKEWMEYMFDHTVLVAQDDPHLFEFQMLNRMLNLKAVHETKEYYN